MAEQRNQILTQLDDPAHSELEDITMVNKDEDKKRTKRREKISLQIGRWLELKGSTSRQPTLRMPALVPRLSRLQFQCHHSLNRNNWLD